MKQYISVLLCLLGVPVCVFAQMPNTLTPVEKVYGLSKFWQEVNYNFVYLDQVDLEKWEADYLRLISEVQQTQDDYEYYRLLKRFCATLKDGHTNVYYPDEVGSKLFNTYFGDYRLIMTHVDGRAIVTRVNESKKREIPIGTEVIRVNGQLTKDYLDKQVKPYISSSTDHIVEDMAVNEMFKAPVGTTFEIEFRTPKGKEFSLTLTHAEVAEQAVHPPFEERELLDFKWMDGQIAYVALNSFDNPKIDTLFEEHLPEIQKAKALVIDLRYNGGGSTMTGLHILKHLSNDTVFFGSKTRSRLHVPAYKAWGFWTTPEDTVGSPWSTRAYLSFHDKYYHDFDYQPDTVPSNLERHVVPTAILIGHNTASAAEDFLIYTDNQNHMTKIGQPTFGSTGQPLEFKLPGGGSGRVCTKKDTYPDGREFVGYGIQPDIIVTRTFEDYLQNRDPELEQAVEFLKGK